MKYKIHLCLLLLIAISFDTTITASEPSTHTGKSISVRYLGSKSTKQMSPRHSPLIPQMLLEPIKCSSSLSSGESFPSDSDSYDDASCSFSHLDSNPVQNIGLNFLAVSVSNAPQTDVIPLNPTGWVGTKQYILMSYQCIRSFDKNTGIPDGVLNTDAASFFGGNAGDIRIVYDRFAKVWYASAEVPNPETGFQDLILAVSSGNVITDRTRWFFYSFSNAQVAPLGQPLGESVLDYQQLASDRNAVYIAVDTFDANLDFLGTSALVIEKHSLLSRNPIVTVFSGLLPGPAQTSEFVPPADNFDRKPRFGYLIHADLAPNNLLYLYRIAGTATDSPSIFGPIAIPVPEYAPPGFAPHQGNLYGPANFLQTGIFGGLMAPHVRQKQLFACHPIQVNQDGVGDPSGDRVGVRWYQIDLTGDSTGCGRGDEKIDTVPSLVQAGTLFDNSENSPYFFYIPSIMTNKKLDMVITSTVSSQSAFTNVAFAGRRKSDPNGFLRDPVQITRNESNAYNFGSSRWGDESGLSPDPTNDLDIWSTGEFAAIPNGWGVQVTQLKRVKPSSKHIH